MFVFLFQTGYTALFGAAESEFNAMEKLTALIENGADVNIQTQVCLCTRCTRCILCPDDECIKKR